jgi:hypothetical protein
MVKRFLILSALLILLAGCAGAPVQEMVRGEPAVLGQSSANDAALQEESFSAGLNAPDAEPVQRMVIKNAHLSIVVDDPAASQEAIAALAEDLGGFVVSSNLTQIRTESGVQVPQADITVRVPAEDLDQALDAIKSGAGRVLSENVSGEDVTQEYTDLSSRLRNLENAEARLTQIMEQAEDTEDVLSVYNRLVEVQEQIELIKGQMQYYERSAALSAISVRIQADEAVQPLKIGGWQPVGVAKQALQALINTLTFFGDAAIWILLYLLPVLLVLVIPLWLLWVLFRRWRKNRRAKRGETVQEAEQTTEN